jgi:hypothetical protein
LSPMFNYQTSKTTSNHLFSYFLINKNLSNSPSSPSLSILPLFLFHKFSPQKPQPPPSSSLNSLYPTLTTPSTSTLSCNVPLAAAQKATPINALTSQQKFFSAVSPPSLMAAPAPAISSPPTPSPIPTQHFLLRQIRTVLS